MTSRSGWGTGMVLITVMALALIAVASWAPGVPPAYAEESPGQATFIAQKCNTCHAVEAVGIEAKVKSEKMKGPDLSKAAERHDVEWLAKFIKKEVDLDDKLHSTEFKGTDEELKAIVEWLGTLAAE